MDCPHHSDSNSASSSNKYGKEPVETIESLIDKFRTLVASRDQKIPMEVITQYCQGPCMKFYSVADGRYLKQNKEEIKLEVIDAYRKYRASKMADCPEKERDMILTFYEHDSINDKDIEQEENNVRRLEADLRAKKRKLTECDDTLKDNQKIVAKLTGHSKFQSVGEALEAYESDFGQQLNDMTKTGTDIQLKLKTFYEQLKRVTNDYVGTGSAPTALGLLEQCMLATHEYQNEQQTESQARLFSRICRYQQQQSRRVIGGFVQAMLHEQQRVDGDQKTEVMRVRQFVSILNMRIRELMDMCIGLEQTAEMFDERFRVLQQTVSDYNTQHGTNG